jgi:hypothetical protein
MKKILTTIALCLALVALMATPVMAAPKTLTFSTELTCTSPGTITGNLEEGFTLTTTADTDTLLYITLDNTIATPDLRDGMYAFSLKAQGPQKAELKSYFAAKEWPYPEYYRQINAEIAGGLPFFYLKFDGDSYSLVDGFVYGISGDDTTTLRINDDYPVGTYVYKGHLKGSNNALLQVTVNLEVVR